MWIGRNCNHALNKLLQIILFQQKKHPIILPSLEVSFSFQLVLNFQCVHHGDLPRTRTTESRAKELVGEPHRLMRERKAPERFGSYLAMVTSITYFEPTTFEQATD
jgi:hypothetical protein